MLTFYFSFHVEYYNILVRCYRYVCVTQQQKQNKNNNNTNSIVYTESTGKKHNIFLYVLQFSLRVVVVGTLKTETHVVVGTRSQTFHSGGCSSGAFRMFCPKVFSPSYKYRSLTPSTRQSGLHILRTFKNTPFWVE